MCRGDNEGSESLSVCSVWSLHCVHCGLTSWTHLCERAVLEAPNLCCMAGLGNVLVNRLSQIWCMLCLSWGVAASIRAILHRCICNIITQLNSLDPTRNVPYWPGQLHKAALGCCDWPITCLSLGMVDLPYWVGPAGQICSCYSCRVHMSHIIQ